MHVHASIFPPIPQYDVSWVDSGPSDVNGNAELQAFAAQLRDEDRQLQGKALLSLQCHDTIVPSGDEWVCGLVPNMPPYQPSPFHIYMITTMISTWRTVTLLFAAIGMKGAGADQSAGGAEGARRVTRQRWHGVKLSQAGE